MITAHGLTKRYGSRTAVDGLDFTVQPGRVTGFLGPNGAGKSTTMRLIVGLDAPTEGTVTVHGKRYREHRAPLREVGVLLDAKGVHPGRSAYKHLLALGATHGIGKERVHEVIGLAGLEAVADKRVRGFSLGMGQRLGIAAALLGDPATVILDEPVNGLDPDGVVWVRQLLRSLAADGRTVLLSSHLMSEMALTADHLIVVGKGRIIEDAPLRDLVDRGSEPATQVRTPALAELRALLSSHGAAVTSSADGTARVTGITTQRIAELAADAGLPLYELTAVTASLEEAYMRLTSDAVEYRSTSSENGTVR